VSRTADIAVVGSGIIGMACALELARAGISVQLIGHQVGRHEGQASRAAGAMLTTFSEVEASQALERVRLDVSERVAARSGYEAWLAGLAELGGIDVPVTPGVWVTASVPNDNKELDAIAAAAVAAGYATERHSPEDFPGLYSETVFEALWVPGDAGVDAMLLADAATAAVRAHPKIALTTTDASALNDSADGIEVVLESGETVSAEQVVLAAGVQIPALLHRSALPELDAPRVLAGRGVSMVLRGGPQVVSPIRTPNRGFACGAHLVARGNGETYLGATNRLTTRPDLARHARSDEISTLLHDGANELNTAVRRAEVVDIRVGYRPYTVDHLPLVGRTRHEPVLLATGTYRCGILLAPRIATLVRQEVEHHGALKDHAYSPLRTIAEPDLATLIRDYAPALSDVVCQPGGRLPAGSASALGTALAMALELARTQPATSRLFATAPVAEVLPLLLDELGRPR
jgi:glycine oxidase